VLSVPLGGGVLRIVLAICLGDEFDRGVLSIEWVTRFRGTVLSKGT
jgi:hypothetical protein